MSKRLLTLTAVLLCAGTTATAQPASAPAKPASTGQPAQSEIRPLAIGDKAPAIKVAKFIKGDPITGFEKGKIYVVEFWATWCGPCKQSIPHLTDLQKQYQGKVTILGVSVWERDQSKVEPFVNTEMGDKMTYTVAMDDVPAGKDGNNGAMARSWMQAAGRDGIPSAFIVNGDGRIAWIGHPMEMDEPLKQVVAGTWDIQKAAKDAADEKKKATDQAEKMSGVTKSIQDFRSALAAKDYDKASKAGTAILNDPNADEQALNFVAWSIVDPKGTVEKKDLDLAMKAAVKADTLAKHEDPAILDTLARVYATKGDYKKAVELETKAVGLAADDMKAELQDSLKEFQAKLGKGPG